MTLPISAADAVVTLASIGPHIALITLNRPTARNAIDARVAVALERAVLAVESDPDMWVAILTGAGSTAFCAGADLKSVAESGFAALYTESGGFAGFTAAKRRKPWIAAVEGFALAGGCEIVLACDLAVAARNAVFGLPEVSRGLIAAAGGLYRLPRRIPKALATELILTAGRLDAPRAAALGLVNHIVDIGHAVERAAELAGAICANAPLAVRSSLAIIKAAAAADDDQLQDMSMAAQEELRTTQDFAEGPRAFIEKRPPRWSGQ